MASARGSQARAPAVLKREFMKMPATSLDYGIAERASNMVVEPSSCGRSDVGSFNALPDVRPVDANGNVGPVKHGSTKSRTSGVRSATCLVTAPSLSGRSLTSLRERLQLMLHRPDRSPYGPGVG